MTVTSPYSGIANTGCGSFSPSAPTQTVSVPANNVIWVDGYTGTTTNCASPAGVKNLVGYPITNDDALTQGNSKLVYGCGNGDVFVEGWVKGQVTVGAANNIIITGDLRYAGKNDAAVGTAVPTTAGVAERGRQLRQRRPRSGRYQLRRALSPGDLRNRHRQPRRLGQLPRRDQRERIDNDGELPEGELPGRRGARGHRPTRSSCRTGARGHPRTRSPCCGGIIQYFRGPVRHEFPTAASRTGYVKNYNYDSGCTTTRRRTSPISPPRPGRRPLRGGHALTAPVALLGIAAGAIGLLIGSFLNVVIHRVPLGESVLAPRSRCPGCGTQLAAQDNIPVLSWLLLRGRCRNCGEPISIRYPLVELLTAAVFVVLAIRLRHQPWALPAFLWLGAVGVALTLIDLDVHRLPDALTLPSYPVAVVLLGGAAMLDHQADPLPRAALGGLVLFALYGTCGSRRAAAAWASVT